MQITIAEAKSTNHGDLSWNRIAALGELNIYEDTLQEELIKNCQKSQIIITNKLKVGREEMDQIPDLKLICQLATGYDNIDIGAARNRGITVCNAVGYGTQSVAQHVFALLLECTNHVGLHNGSVQRGEWSSKSWSYTVLPLKEIAGKKLGIYGFGKIGQAVSRIARAFGMIVSVHTRTPKPHKYPNIQFVELEKLCSNSDVISLHAPLSNDNEGIINSKLLNLMKEDAILINTGRGGLIHESDLRNHLLQHPQFTAALDVLSQEPPSIDQPLIGLSNCIITPHNAWVAREARQRLIDIVADNIQAFLNGSPQNVVT